jgi:hypothetical protein
MMSISGLFRYSGGDTADNAFPLQMNDPMVAALVKGGHDDLAGRLSYELNAAKGNSLTSHFNAAANGGRTGGIALRRRATADARVTDLREAATRLLGTDSDHDGGGAPAAAAMPAGDKPATAFSAATDPAAKPACEQAPAVSGTRIADSRIPRAPWEMLGGK